MMARILLICVVALSARVIDSWYFKENTDFIFKGQEFWIKSPRAPWPLKIKVECSFKISGINNPATQYNNTIEHNPQSLNKLTITSLLEDHLVFCQPFDHLSCALSHYTWKFSFPICWIKIDISILSSVSCAGSNTIIASFSWPVILTSTGFDNFASVTALINIPKENAVSFVFLICIKVQSHFHFRLIMCCWYAINWCK